MLSTLLTHIETVIRQKRNLSDSIIRDFVAFLGSYKVGMWIYPGVLKRKFGLSIVEAYEILDLLEKESIVKGYYELYCAHCQKSSGIVHVFNELPETFQCEICHEELDSLKNAVLIYQVVKDE